MMKKLSIVQMVVALFLATPAFAGSLTMSGSFVVSNVAAQSITLGSQTRSNWLDESSGGAIDLTNAVLDFAQQGFFYRFTLTNNTTWVFTNHVAGRAAYLYIAEDATGGWNNIWPAGLLWPGGYFRRPTL